MPRARYRFDTQRKYFAWAVSGVPRQLPGIGETHHFFKVTLATPYHLDGEVLRASQQWEAVLWLNTESDDDQEFLDQAGFKSNAEGEYFISSMSIRLWCQFGEPKRDSGYQALEVFEIVQPNEYSVEPQAVSASARSGLVFLPDHTVEWNGTPIEVGGQKRIILDLLDGAFGRPVPMGQIAKALGKQNNVASTRTIVESISQTRKLLPKNLAIIYDKSLKGNKLVNRRDRQPESEPPRDGSADRS